MEVNQGLSHKLKSLTYSETNSNVFRMIVTYSQSATTPPSCIYIYLYIIVYICIYLYILYVCKYMYILYVLYIYVYIVGMKVYICMYVYMYAADFRDFLEVSMYESAFP